MASAHAESSLPVQPVGTTAELPGNNCVFTPAHDVYAVRHRDVSTTDQCIRRPRHRCQVLQGNLFPVFTAAPVA